MRRIYQRFVNRRAFLVRRTKTAILSFETREYIVATVGFATFFFGFFAGAILNLYLLAIDSPLVTHFRSSLSYKSAIFGDGILLPVINMIAVAFILKQADFIGKKTIQFALVAGMSITAWFHVNQALHGIVNWAMPQPWHWNILGLWHAIYMFCVASLISLFYLVVFRFMREEKDVPIQAIVVTIGIAFFFFLLRLDYISLNLSSLFPRI